VGLTLPAPLTANDTGLGSGPDSLLRATLLRRLNDSLRSTTSKEAAAALRQVRGALRANTLGIALRTVDRAWRCLDDDAATLAPVYGHLLTLEGRDHDTRCACCSGPLNSHPMPALLP
jgi:hypothetical protein